MKTYKSYIGLLLVVSFYLLSFPGYSEADAIKFWVLGIDEWNSIARAKHGGSDTEMANALAQEGWELTQLSMVGIVLKRNSFFHLPNK
jgi:hypothetical protein